MGLLLEVMPQQVKAVATDGHRLAVAHLDTATGVEESKSIIVPRKGVLELARLLTTEDVQLEVRAGTNAVQMVIDNVRFSSKLIDGRFPDYGRVVPDAEQCDKRLSMDREALRQSPGSDVRVVERQASNGSVDAWLGNLERGGEQPRAGDSGRRA